MSSVIFRHRLQNWWELSKYHEDHGSELTYDEFIETVQYQIDKKIAKTKDNKIFNEKYHLDGFQLVFERHQWQALIETMKELPKHYYPVLTIHATSNPSQLQSIGKWGYLMPGDSHPESGYPVSMANGNYYGDGIYSSTEFKTSSWYSFIDLDQAVQVIVNLQLVGDMCIIDDSYGNISGDDSDDDSGDDSDYWSYDYGSYITSIINEKYSDGYHTRTPAVHGHDVARTFVSASPRYITPLMIITARPDWNHAKMAEYLMVNHKSDKVSKGNKKQKQSKGQDSVHELISLSPNPSYAMWWKMASNCSVTLRQICDDYYLVQDAPSPKSEKTVKSHLVVPASSHSLMTLTNFVKILGKADVTIYNQNEIGFKNYGSVDGDQFLSHFKASVAERQVSQLDLYQPLDRVFSKIETGDPDTINIVYLLVNQSWSITTQINAIMEAHSMYLKAKQVVIKLIFMNPCLTNEMMSGCHFIKLHLQNLGHFEVFSHAIDQNLPLETCLEILQSEIANITPAVKYCIPYPLGRVHQGFLSRLDQPPTWDAKITTCTIYRGSQIPCIYIDSVLHKTKFVKTDLAQDDCDSFRDQSLSAILVILCQFRNYVMAHTERILRLMPSIDNLCQAYLKLAETETNPSTLKQSIWKLNGIVSELQTYAKANFKGAWFEHLTSLKFGRSIIRRAHNGLMITADHLKELQCVLKQRKPFKEASDVLGFDPSVGFALNLSRSNASEVEPWLIRVNLLSTEANCSVMEMYRFVELGERLKSDAQPLCEYDVLILNKDRHPLIHQMHLAYTFTRNPYLCIPGQDLALLTVAWTHQVETLMKQTGHPQVEARLVQCIDLYRRVKLAFSQGSHLNALLDQILLSEDAQVLKYLTETNHVSSISQILGLLTQYEAQPLFTSHKNQHRFAFALLAEAVMRSTRVMIRGSGLGQCASQTMIRKAFKLKSETDLQSYQFQLNKAVKKSHQCYAENYTNTTPFTVVAVYGFLKFMHTGQQNRLLTAYQTGEISMREFLATHLPNCDKYETQVALYLQGLRYHSGSSRQDVKFDDPHQIIADLLDEQLRLIKHEQLIRSTARDRIDQRRIARLALAEPYLEFHAGLPRLFTQKEVDELNLNRSVEDQLILKETGLLKYHCCFANCPLYLTCVATANDLKMDSTHGLDRHMNPCRYLGTYIKGLHQFAKQVAKHSLSKFEELMTEYAKRDGSVSWLTVNEIKALWESYHK
jgi:hypothetical protein